MTVRIPPTDISGVITSPASKSSMQRACAAALLSNGETYIINPGKSNDDLAALEVSKMLGATITKQANGNLLMTGSKLLNPAKPAFFAGDFDDDLKEEQKVIINCGESGLGMRMFTPLAALGNREVIINGEGSLLLRPMNFFDEIFPKLGIAIESNNGRLPIKIKGPLQPTDITIDGSLSSQFLTGLLMAFGRAVTKPVSITVTNLKSKPYIDLTLQVMKHFGYAVVNNNFESFIVKPVDQTANRSIHYTVEGDWSGAAFLLVAGAISGSIILQGLDVFSTQADKAILHALTMAEAGLSIEEKQIVISPGKLKPFHFNATDCPDLFPPLVALASYCNGTTVIEGVNRLAHKESDRGATLQEEFGKMGVNITRQGDLMLIEGGNGVKGAKVHSNHDHRIAMACAVAALKAEAPVVIEEAEAVNKSYPGFYDDLRKLGVAVSN